MQAPDFIKSFELWLLHDHATAWSTGAEISIIKKRWSGNCLIFMMEIPIPGKTFCYLNKPLNQNRTSILSYSCLTCESSSMVRSSRQHLILLFLEASNVHRLQRWLTLLTGNSQLTIPISTKTEQFAWLRGSVCCTSSTPYKAYLLPL